jgi:hypothetical protein
MSEFALASAAARLVRGRLAISTERVFYMSRLRLMLLSFFAMGALTGVAATAAQATPPFWNVNKVKLEVGKTAAAELKGGAALLKAGTVEIECGEVKTKPGSVITGGQPGGAEGVLVYTKCSFLKESNGPGCVLAKGGVASEEIVPEPIKAKLVTTNPLVAGAKLAAGEGILIVVEPAKANGILVKIETKAEKGGTCNAPSFTFEGAVAGEALDEKKRAVTVESNEPEVEVGFINFPEKSIEQVAVDEGTKMVERRVKMSTFGKTATLKGVAEVKLTSKEKFGVHTK